MTHWYILSVVGKDRPGIVSHVTTALYDGGCNLGETSMIRLGDSFTIMMMVRHDGTVKSLQNLLATVAESMGLHVHVDNMDGHLHRHLEPDVHITVYGADRPGIVAHVTGALAEAGLNIVNLDSDVGGTEDQPLYVMHIDGVAGEGIKALESALDVVVKEGVEARLSPIDTMIG
ncbi:amino acid-binding protein [Candidatus Tenderia electrophaga]|jgi:glycine cleavage system transcriptional repressor|uniref:Amino acid-binding protein n=1 Tax=Candidatus Tenderia electrophaga TaxID=1748243 RepID=A0A0S2TCG7_9GAMM|nr:amino acid-binding protein [Candidatus Tenderia electrophaga]